MNLERLKAPFPVNDVSWRIGQAGKNGERIWAKVLAYLDNRAIMERLDDVCGPENWRNEYAKGPEGGVLCCIYIKIAGEWVGKWDGADNTDVEATKGGLSDAMKRAAVQWGIGRYLYELGESWAEIVEQKTPGAIYAKSEKAGTFYWLPPKNVLPTDAPSTKDREKPPFRADSASDIPSDWLAKFADAQQDIAAADSIDRLNELKKSWNEIAMPEPVKAKLRPLIVARQKRLEATSKPNSSGIGANDGHSN